MKLSIDKIKSSTTDYLKSVIKDGFADIETEDMIFKELFHMWDIKKVRLSDKKIVELVI